MNVVLKKIEDLKGYDKNARMHSKAQIKEILFRPLNLILHHNF